MGSGEDLQSPRRTRWLWRSSGCLTISWWATLVCFVAVLSVVPLVAGKEIPGNTQAEHEASSDLTPNFDERMDPFWEGCQNILLDIEPFESWFDDAETNTAVIAALVNAVPFSDNARNADVVSWKTEAAVHQRKEDLAKAKNEFDGFLALRRRVMHSVFSNSTLWYYYADAQEVKDLLKVANHRQQTEVNAVLEREAAVDAAQITSYLLQVHWDMWNHEGIGMAMITHLAAALKHVKDARSHESQAVWHLAGTSARFNVWASKFHGEVLLRLENKLIGIYGSSGDLMRSLEWAQEHVHVSKADVTPPQKKAREWTMRLERLLRGWVELLQASHQGMLFFLRTIEVQAARKKGPAHFDYDKSWTAWKRRNCGGTSCFDDGGFVHRILGAFGVSYLPLARHARDEQAWCKKQKPPARPFVWRGVYEDACCKGGDLALFLKYGPLATYRLGWEDE